MRKWLVVTLAVLVVAVSAAGYAGEMPLPPQAGGPHPPAGFMGKPGGADPGPGCGGPMFFHPGFAAYLNMSKAQMDKMAEIRDRTDRECRELEYKLAHKHLEMRELFADPKAGESTLLEKQKELSALEGKLHSKKASAMIKMRSVLTPEQIVKLDRRPPMPPHDARADKQRGEPRRE